MAMEELIAYVVLLSLPLWLLVEQLLFLRVSRRANGRTAERRPRSAPAPGAEAPRRAPSRALHGALRSGQR
jgi:hypothetical protein